VPAGPVVARRVAPIDDLHRRVRGDAAYAAALNAIGHINAEA
jgi:hypothetical protein